MDSIFEQPRSCPKRTPVTQNFQAPVVPEASLIFQNDPKDTRSTKTNSILPHQQSYNAWKIQNYNKQNDDSLVTNKMNNKYGDHCQNYVNYQYQYMKGPCDTSTNKSMLKKVRFEPPQMQTSAPIVRSPNFQALLRSSSDSYRVKSDPKGERKPQIDTGQYMAPLRAPKYLNNTDFGDDSLLCLPKNSPKPNRKSIPNIGALTYQNGNRSQAVKATTSQNKPPSEEFRQDETGLDDIRPSRTHLDNYNHKGAHLESQDNEIKNTRTEDLFEKSTLNSDSLKKFTLPHILEQQTSLLAPEFVKESIPIPQILSEKPLESNFEQKTEQQKQNIEDKSKICSCKCQDKSENKENEPKNPSVAELLNIVKIQNEQLQLLQNQVEQLIKLNEKNRQYNIEKAVNAIVKYTPKTPKVTSKKFLDKSVEVELDKKSKPRNVLYKDENVGTSYNDGISKKVTQENILSHDKNDKISVGIMTSFQVKYTPPFKNKKKVTQKRRENRIESSSDDYDIETSYSNQKVFTDTWHDKREQLRYREVDEDSFDEKNDDVSLDIGFRESLKVQEPPLSPNHTVHVDMQDYSSDSDDESSSEDPGWTFYDNILGQVNNILENSPTQNRVYKGNRHMPQKSTDRTMELIKQTTLNNLKEQGLVGRSGEYANMKPSEISFAVQQILMKYMSDEELANFAQKNKRNIEQTENQRPENYRIPKGNQRLGNNYGRHPKLRSRTSNPGSPKILDITTLKKQPKLL